MLRQEFINISDMAIALLELFGQDIWTLRTGHHPFPEAQTAWGWYYGDGTISEIMVNGKYTISLPFKIELL